MVDRGTRLGIKLEKYLCSRRMVCVVALSTRQLTFSLVMSNYKLIESVTWIKKNFIQLINIQKQ